MGVADRLITTNTGDGQDGVMNAPGTIPRDGDFDSTSEFRDVRGNRVQVVTLVSYGGTDSFTLGVRIPNLGFQTSIAFVRGTNGTAAAIQAELRTLTGDSALTVTGTTDEGPFTITHTPGTFLRDYPRYVVNGTGCSGAAVALPDPEGDGTIGALGESHRVSETDSILKPTIGTITVTDSTHRKDTLALSAGTDGGTVSLRVGGRSTGGIAWDAYMSVFNAALLEAGSSAQATITTGAEVATLDLDDIGAADTFKVTYNSVATAAAITYAATLTTEIQAAVDEVLGGSGRATVAKVDSNTYTITRLKAGAFATTFTATSPSGFTPLGTGGYTAGGKITTPAADPTYTFTYATSTPGPAGTITVALDSLTDGGVAEPATFTPSATAGVLGSASAAYTENGAGDSVLASAVNDTTGKSYGFTKDASTPVVTASLPPGSYHMILRTVEDGRVSKADTKAFTVT